ncbi:hypothetical protein BGZ76_006495 [Entomortierella beljakovae]|nr:hypothetical protein BGZ76_006495 [Entomortierella beljakovae]
MRITTVEYKAPVSEKKSLARDQLNLPIARIPISIQSSTTTRSAHLTVHNAPLSPSSPISPTNTVVSKAHQINKNTVLPKELQQQPLIAKKSSEGQASNRLPHPKLLEITTQFQDIHSANSVSNTNNSDSYRAPSIHSKVSARRVSWSPSQAIPGGHYSKGFTLTTFQKTTEKSSVSSTTSSNPSPFAFTTNSSSSPASTSLKRSNTNHLQRKETLTPFRRFVGRSKSMRVKTPGPFVITETDSALRTDRFDSFYNDEKENSNIQTIKTSDMYITKFKDKNAPGDLGKHSNGMQSQEKLTGKKAVDIRKETTSVAMPVLQGLTTIIMRPTIAPISNGPVKPLWQQTMTTTEHIRILGLSQQEIQKQETIFELIYTESEYLDDLKTIHKIFVEELNVRMAESRKKKRFSPDKSDVKLYERLARLLSHIKDLWNGHQSLLRSLQNKQQQGKPVVVDIGSVFESFYMFSIYDSYFAQYTTTSRDFHQISIGNSELCLILRDLLKSPRCKNLTLEGIFLKPIQRLQKYPLFFKDLLNLTPHSDPDHQQLERALNNHQRELTKIDDRIWVEEHNVMLMDLQQRIKGLPSNFSLVERHRYLILDGPVHRITLRQPSKYPLGKHGLGSKSESYASNGSNEWNDGFRSPVISNPNSDDDPPTLIHRPSQLDFHHLHAKPVFPASPPSSSASSASSYSGPSTPNSSFPNILTFKARNHSDSHCDATRKSAYLYSSSSPPPSATTLHSLSSMSSPIPIPNSNSHSSSSSTSTSTKHGTVMHLVSHALDEKSDESLPSQRRNPLEF